MVLRMLWKQIDCVLAKWFFPFLTLWVILMLLPLFVGREVTWYTFAVSTLTTLVSFSFLVIIKIGGWWEEAF